MPRALGLATVYAPMSSQRLAVLRTVFATVGDG